MTKQLQEGDLALVISGVLMGESVELLALINPGDVITIHGKTYDFNPKPRLACWHVKWREGWAVKSPGTLMPIGSQVAQTRDAWEATE